MYIYTFFFIFSIMVYPSILNIVPVLYSRTLLFILFRTIVIDFFFSSSVFIKPVPEYPRVGALVPLYFGGISFVY